MNFILKIVLSIKLTLLIRFNKMTLMNVETSSKKYDEYHVYIFRNTSKLMGRRQL